MKRKRFYTKERKGKLSLWVRMPHGVDYNIWDIPHGELTPGVQQAIASAFSRGVESTYEMLHKFNGSEIHPLTGLGEWDDAE